MYAVSPRQTNTVVLSPADTELHRVYDYQDYLSPADLAAYSINTACYDATRNYAYLVNWLTTTRATMIRLDFSDEICPAGQILPGCTPCAAGSITVQLQSIF